MRYLGLLLILTGCSSLPYYQPTRSETGKIVHSACPSYDAVEYDIGNTVIRVTLDPSPKTSDLSIFSVSFLVGKGDSVRVLTTPKLSIPLDQYEISVTQGNKVFTDEISKIKIPTRDLTYRKLDDSKSWPTTDYKFTFELRPQAPVVEIEPPSFIINGHKTTPAAIKFELQKGAWHRGC